MTATCIACCPHQANIVAIGAKSGLVYIVNLQGSGTITYKLRGHDVDITSLSWCPSDKNILTETAATDLLLASGAKDKSIFIWRAGGDGRYEAQLTLPNIPLTSNQHKIKLNPSVGSFTALCWVESRCLLASSSYGELLAVDLCVGLKKPTWTLLHGQHNRGLFTIAHVPVLSTEKQENWRLNRTFKVWTTAQDRQLICNSVKRDICTLEYNIPTQAGYIYCIAACPLDTSRIAFGAGDALLRLWNLSEPHENTFDIVMLWQKIMSRVTAIAWHPEQENLLAFGTAEGRIGVFDTNNVSKAPILYRQHHRRTVYSIGWGPKPLTKNYALYSCGDNELIYYNPEKTNAQPTVFIKKDCTEFNWKPDFSCLAVGFDDGSILFYDKTLKICGKPIFTVKKAIQCLAWHPDSTATDLNLSPLQNYLAIASNATTISVFDMSAMITELNNPNSIEKKDNDNKNENNEENDNKLCYTLVGTLCGHVDRVVSLAWSPHFSGHLVSVSIDHTAQVWKIDTQELIATFTGHNAPIYCCMWSPLDPDLIITGSADFSLRMWKVSDQKIVIPTLKIKPKKKTNKKNKAKNGTVVSCKEDSIINSLPMDCNQDCADSEATDEAKAEPKNVITKERKNIKSKKPSFLSTYRKTMSDKQILLSTCLKLARNIMNEEKMDIDILENNEIRSIYGNKEDVSKIINTEIEMHNTQGHNMMTAELNLWNNNLRQELQDAASERRLTDFLVSLAPSLSVKIWQEMCESYAAQLVTEDNPMKAVSYLLCIHKIHQAIAIFHDAKLYREAYCLAKCKLDPSDAVFEKILTDWSNHSVHIGSFEDAAQCCIILGDLGKAAKILAKRKDVAFQETAAEIASLAKDEELSKSIADEAVVECLIEFDYPKVRELIEKFPSIKYRWFHVEALEEMKKTIDSLDDGHIVTWLNGKSDINLIQTLRLRYKQYDCANAYNELSAIVDSNVPNSEQSLWLMVSQQIALAAFSEDKQISHIVSALGLISQYEVMYPSKNTEQKTNFLINLLSILEPLVTILADELNLTVQKSYRAFACLGLLSWTVERFETATDNVNADNCVDIATQCIVKTLNDGLDKEAVKYWTMTTEMGKLESSLAENMKNGHKNDIDEGKEKDKSSEDSLILLQKMDTMRKDKEKFIADRVCAPMPILLYSKAMKLSSALPNEEVKDNFAKTVAAAWMVAVS